MTDETTFSNLLDVGEPAVASSGYGAIDEDWTECENWIQIIGSRWKY